MDKTEFNAEHYKPSTIGTKGEREIREEGTVEKAGVGFRERKHEPQEDQKEVAKQRIVYAPIKGRGKRSKALHSKSNPRCPRPPQKNRV